MKILNWFKSKTKDQNSIEYKCKKYGIENYTINEDGSIDVDGDVDLSHKKLTKLPLKFGRVAGYFDCYNNQLTTLEGSPYWVGKEFDCGCNQLKTIEGGPETVIREYYCNNNQLTSLDGCPDYVGGDFFCGYIDNGYVTIHEGVNLFDHKSFIKQYKREQKLKELLEN